MTVGPGPSTRKPASAPPTGLSSDEERPPHPKTVLLVDDEEDILASIQQYFSQVLPSVRLLLARSGSEGVRTLQGESVDLIITDYRMGDMDGLEFLEVAETFAPGAPRVMITAYPDPQLAVEARVQRNVALMVTKPFDIDSFGRSIAALLGLPPTA